MVPLYLGYESGKLFTKANKDNCLTLFFTLVRQMMFLSWSVLFPPISCKSSWHSQRRFSAQVGTVKGYFTALLVQSRLVQSF